MAARGRGVAFPSPDVEAARRTGLFGYVDVDAVGEFADVELRLGVEAEGDRHIALVDDDYGIGLQHRQADGVCLAYGSVDVVSLWLARFQDDQQVLGARDVDG